MKTKLFPLSSLKALLALLAALGLLLIGLAYQLGWPKYFQLRNAQKMANEKLWQARSADQEIIELKESLNGAGGKQSYHALDFMAQIMDYCEQEKITIVNFPEALQLKQEGQAIITHELEVQGAYQKLVSLAYFIEREEKLSAIASMSFEKQKDKYSKRNKLIGKLILRNIIQP